MNNNLIIRRCDLADIANMNTTNCDIRIENGMITEIGCNRNLVQKGEEIIDAKGMLCIPAFTDTHTHLVQSLQKGCLDDLCITDWLVKMLSTQHLLTEEE